MSSATASVAARRIAEHAAAHEVPQVSVTLHGGEPLLLGPARLRSLLTELRRTVTAVCRLDLRMQTNGVRLDAAHAEVLLEAGVRVGVSLDGDRPANDRHRVFRRGASSYDRTLRGIGVSAMRRAACSLMMPPEAIWFCLLASYLARVDERSSHALCDSQPEAASSPEADDPTHPDWMARRDTGLAILYG